MDNDDKIITEGVLSRVDLGHYGGDMAKVKEAFKSIVKTMRFLGFYGESVKVNPLDSKGG